ILEDLSEHVARAPSAARTGYRADVNAGVSTEVAAVEHSPLTRSSSRPVFAWPGWRHLGRTLWYSGLTAALFAVVFGGADALSRLHSSRVDLAIPADGS